MKLRKKHELVINGFTCIHEKMYNSCSRRYAYSIYLNIMALTRVTSCVRWIFFPQVAVKLT